MYQQEELSIKYKAPKSVVVVVVAECLGTNHWPRARWRAEMVPESRAGIVCIELYSTLCSHTWHLRPKYILQEPPWHHRCLKVLATFGHGDTTVMAVEIVARYPCDHADGLLIFVFVIHEHTEHTAIPWIMILHQTLNRFNHLWLMANATEVPVFISTSNDF